MGFPPYYREDEYVVNSISSFGRVISWVDDAHHLLRILVRARVVDYESVPQFLVLSDGEGFQGESWTVQCEILQGHLLGGLPQDEDPAPGPDDFPPRGPFDLFGFGQAGPAPFGPSNHQGGPGGGILGHGFVDPVDDDGPVDEDFNQIPADDQEVFEFDLNEEPKNQPEINLNESADMQEMVVDPVDQGPIPQEAFLELNDLLNQVNEDEEDAQFDGNEIDFVQNELVDAVNNQADMEVAFPAVLEPMMPLENQEDDLMNEAEIQQ